MKHTVGALLLSTFFGISAFAAPATPASLPINAIVRLASPRHEVCGSGFIGQNGYIVTNAHLVRSLCPAGDCSDLTVGSAPAIGAPPVTRALTVPPRVVAVLPVFDLGFIDAHLPPSIFPIGAAAQVNDEVATLGFPGCKTLEYSSGVVTATDALHLTTTLSGGHGSSGSPIVSSTGAVVGIVDEAAHLLDSIGGGPFSLRGSRLDGATELPPNQGLPLQLERLAAFHRNLPNRSLPERIRGSFDLVVAMEGLNTVARDLPPNNEVTAVLARGAEILSSPPAVLSDPIALLAESLTVEYALQHHLSLRTSGLRTRYRAALETRGRNGDHLFPSPPVPTVYDLNAMLVLGFGLLLALFGYFLVRAVRFFRRPRTA